MLLREYIALNDLWSAINDVEAFPFIADKTPATLNSFLVFKWGDRTMYEGAATATIETVANMVVSNFSEKWSALITINAATPSLLSGRVEKLTETVTNAETRVNVRDDVNKVSAFNSDTLLDNDGSTSNANEEVDGEKGRTLTKEISAFSDAYKNLDSVEKTAIIQTVTRDVSEFLTLSIY